VILNNSSRGGTAVIHQFQKSSKPSQWMLMISGHSKTLFETNFVDVERAYDFDLPQSNCV